MKQKKYSVKAILRKDKISASDNKCLIALLVYLDGKQFKLSTGHKIEAKYWDSLRGRAKSSYPFATELNQTLSHHVASVEGHIHQRQSFNEPYDKESITQFFYGTDNAANIDFLAYFENAVLTYSSKLSAGTIRIYRVTLNKLKRFKDKIEFRDIDEKFIEDFDTFLLQGEGNTRNGAFNKHKHLRKVIGKAVKEGLLKRNPYEGMGGRFSEEETNKDYLTPEELALIERAVLHGSRGSKIDEVREMFLFACNTGLRFSDIITLKKRDIRGNILKKVMYKTRKTIELPLNLKALAILEMYIDDATPSDSLIFMGISNQKYNTNLGRICSQLGISKRITSHTARHTFASMLANSDNNAFLIKDVLGHSSMKMASKYVQMNMNKKFEALQGIHY